jgi:hypothetical protein
MAMCEIMLDVDETKVSPRSPTRVNFSRRCETAIPA